MVTTLLGTRAREFRVVDATGATAAVYPVGRNEHDTRLLACHHAGRIGGRVFMLSDRGFLYLVFGAREAA